MSYAVLDPVTRYALTARARTAARFAVETPGPHPFRKLDLELSGAPYRRASLYACVRPYGTGIAPWRVHLGVYALDGEPLARPVFLSVDLRPVSARVNTLSPPRDVDSGGAGPDIIRVRGRIWSRCPGPSDVSYREVAEVRWSSTDGAWRVVERGVLHRADLYRVQCDCGRFRYASRSAVGRTVDCRVCAWQLQRFTRRVAWTADQLERRRRMNSGRKPLLTADAEARIIRRVVTDGCSQRAAAREAGVAPSTVCRLLRRRGLA